MRLKEFVFEVAQKKISNRQRQSSRGINTFSDAEKANSDYVAYRLGMAVACANGTDPIEMKGKSWIGKKKATFPYSEVEQEMLKQAYKAVGAKYDDVNGGDMNSDELDTTSTASPVATPKKNKYGV